MSTAGTLLPRSEAWRDNCILFLRAATYLEQVDNYFLFINFLVRRKKLQSKLQLKSIKTEGDKSKWTHLIILKYLSCELVKHPRPLRLEVDLGLSALRWSEKMWHNFRVRVQRLCRSFPPVYLHMILMGLPKLRSYKTISIFMEREVFCMYMKYTWTKTIKQADRQIILIKKGSSICFIFHNSGKHLVITQDRNLKLIRRVQ